MMENRKVTIGKFDYETSNEKPRINEYYVKADTYLCIKTLKNDEDYGLSDRKIVATNDFVLNKAGVPSVTTEKEESQNGRKTKLNIPKNRQ